MKRSASPEVASSTSHVKFDLRKSLERSGDASSSDGKDGGTAESPLEPTDKTVTTDKMDTTDKTESESESGSDSRSEEDKESPAPIKKIKAEAPQPKDRSGVQVTC